MKITSDWADIEAAVTVLAEAPSSKSVTALNLALASLFEDTQLRVHVITGSLKASGKTDSAVRKHAWIGEISYGGASPGSINNPVRYAWAEQRRDGAHDFMADVNTDIGDDMMLSAVELTLEG